jgi:hypothetical protein
VAGFAAKVVQFQTTNDSLILKPTYSTVTNYFYLSRTHVQQITRRRPPTEATSFIIENNKYAACFALGAGFAEV